MREIIMLNTPTTMSTEIELFSKAIRQQPKQKSTRRYHEFICENIVGVIENTFPLFSETQSADDLNQLANEFIYYHGATEPEFHQIATEFVQFSQKRAEITPPLLKLIEYEWVTFNVEIAMERMDKVHPSWEEIAAQPDVFTLSCNSVMQLIEVPFLVEEDTVNFLSKDEDFVVYGVYRTKENIVVSQKLRNIDVAIIQLISQTPKTTLAKAEQHIHTHLAGFDFMHSVHSFTQNQLITIQFLGDKHD